MAGDAADLRQLLPSDFQGLVAVLVDTDLPDAEQRINAVRECLKPFPIVVDGRLGAGKLQSQWAFGVRCKAVERCRDALKQLFFCQHLKSSPAPFSLSNFVTFVALPKPPLNGSTVEHTFVHGEGRFYRYWYDEARIPKRRDGLARFLQGVTVDCPNHIFFSGPKASKGGWPLRAEKKDTKCCALVVHAASSKTVQLRKRAHENLERFLMLNDPRTFACEIPVWLEPSDYKNFKELFGVMECITGHIDILTLEDDERIGVWDYKPNARNEEKAPQQVAFYMLMLAKRTGMRLNEIRGGYFDEHDAFEVRIANPELYSN